MLTYIKDCFALNFCFMNSKEAASTCTLQVMIKKKAFHTSAGETVGMTADYLQNILLAKVLLREELSLNC